MTRQELEIYECSIVAAASNHNPTILNPDFLKRNGIIPEEWEAKKVLCTEVISQVVFGNGLGITIEPKRIIFLENDPERSTLPRLDEISVRYVQTLPHAAYTAVGINFKAVVAFKHLEEAKAWLLENLVSSGPWKSIDGGLKGASLTLVYEIQAAKLTLKLDPAEVQRAGEPSPRPVVLFDGNFHRELPKDNHSLVIPRMEAIMNAWTKDRRSFSKVVEKILPQR